MLPRIFVNVEIVVLYMPVRIWRIQRDGKSGISSNFTHRYAPRSVVCKYVQNAREHFVGRCSSAYERLLEGRREPAFAKFLATVLL